MALVYDGVRCSICGERLDLQASCFATSGVFFPPEHPLFPFCDTPMHWECYATWPERPAFARAYVEACIGSSRNSAYWGVALESDRVFVSVNPDAEVSAVDVLLTETGSSLRFPLGNWERWLAHPAAVEVGRHPVERAILRDVLPELRAVLPTTEALVGRVDWAAVRAARARRRMAERRFEEERLRRPRLHNKECRRLLREGFACPYCAAASGIHFIDKSPEGKSSFLCGQCGRSFGPIDVTVGPSGDAG